MAAQCAGFWAGEGADEPVSSPCAYDCAAGGMRAPGGGRFPSIRSIPPGDVISLGDLLRLAGALDRMDKGPRSLRDEGGILMIDVIYDNFQKWDFLGRHQQNITYTYRPRLVPTKNYKRMYIQAAPGARERVLHNFHGFDVVIAVHGNLVAFNMTHLLLVLTTSVTLLAVSHCIVDTTATRLLALRAKYALLKSQSTDDFSDYRRRRTFVENAERRFKDHHRGPGAAKEGQEEFSCRTNWSSMLFHSAVRRAQEGVEVAPVKFAILPGEEDLLALLLKHEQRLNGIDAFDETFANSLQPAAQDRLYEYIHEFKANFDICIGRLAREWDEERDEGGAPNTQDKLISRGSSSHQQLNEQMMRDYAEMKSIWTQRAVERRELLMKDLRYMLSDSVRRQTASAPPPELVRGGDLMRATSAMQLVEMAS